MNSPVIKVEGIGKQYRLGEQGPAYLTLRDSLSNLFRKTASKNDFIWALKDITFNVNQGEVIGVIGRNGAGKSTLLKVLSRITEPTEGKATLIGRIGSLLEVGAGFHSELTGRENIFLNGAILGMCKAEIKRKFDEIVSFSELEKFIDTPVKYYSSGMYIRLGFAVAAHLETEILMVDEVLSVGDVAFQEKCLGKIGNVAKSGRTIFFVSHNMGAIKNLCKRTLLIDQGRIVHDGETDKAINLYLDRNRTEGSIAFKELCQEKVEGRKANPTFSYHSVGLYNSSDQPSSSFVSDEPIKVVVAYECIKPINDVTVIVQIVDEENRPIVLSANTDDKDESNWYKREEGMYESVCTIPAHLLGEKNFYVTIHLVSPTSERLILNKILKFHVHFKGYNNVQDDYTKNAFVRPQLNWQTKKLTFK
jgi:lipopolysaccharide transport system ATP-binding protein